MAKRDAGDGSTDAATPPKMGEGGLGCWVVKLAAEIRFPTKFR